MVWLEEQYNLSLVVRMSSISKRHFVLLLCVGVQAVILPGKCPQTPPRHSLPKNMTNVYYNIIRLVPFSADNPSYLFRDINETLLPGLVFQYTVGKNIEITLEYSTAEKAPTNFVQSYSQYSNGILIFNSSVSYFDKRLHRNVPTPCYKPISEEIKTWIDGSFLFLYSCKNFNGSHEEAVIMIYIKPDFYVEYNDKNGTVEILNHLQIMARRYLSETLLNHIVWSYIEYPTSPLDFPSHELFQCPEEKKSKETYKWIFFIIIFLMCVCVMGVLFWYIVKYD